MDKPEVLISPPLTPPGQELEPAEREKLENYHLKAVLLQKDIEILDMKKQATYEALVKLAEEMNTYKNELAKKYASRPK